MADIAVAVRTYLLADATITTLIGTRMWSDLLPQDAELPAVEFSKISTRHDMVLGGPAGLAHCRLQFDCKADRAAGGRLKANEIAEAIRDSGILGYRGVVGGVDIRGARPEDGQRNSIDYANDDSDDHVYVTSFDLEVDYLESI